MNLVALQWNWATFYLVITLAPMIWGMIKKDYRLFDYSFALLVWFVLAQITYEAGIKELIPTAGICGVWLVLCNYLMRLYPGHIVPRYFFVAGLGMLSWTALQNYIEVSTYAYKGIKNLVYLSEVIVMIVLWAVARKRA